MNTAFIAQWHLRPLVWLCLLALGLGYGRWLQHLRAQQDPSLNRVQPWAFVAGLGLMALLTASPLDDLGRRALFCARMFEFMLMVYVLPCLLWLGTPAGMLASLWLRLRDLPSWLGGIVGPSLGFNLAFLLLHLPPVYELGLRNSLADQLILLFLLLLGYLMWLPLLSPYAPLRLPMPRQMFYLVTLVFAQVPVFALLTLSREALYASYLEAPRITPLSAFADQQLGGWMLKTVSSVIFAAAFIRIFLDWNSRARLQDAEDNLTAFENIDLVRRARQRKG
ncbi:MAG: hypothetical protein CVV27_14715 [Candidatus Melainabacteria bacterium HGW-Melainabacteria-1]|nr:MAG: hypothetical protein CVV27_14715 [Candidatus Melainabacteria bacterium HGW-Melainabacteria-1]